MNYSFAQTINFSFNVDSSYAGKQMTYTNTSTGFPPNTQFIWNNGECKLDSTILISNCNDTLIGNAAYSHVFWIPGFYINTLTANNNGIVYKFTDTIFINPPKQLLAMSCDCNNIILNPGFENFNFCPNLNFPNGLNPAFAGGALVNWYQPPMLPGMSTPDPNYILTNSCSPGGGVNPPAWMPCNPFGFEQGFNSSNAYIGLITYNPSGIREYAEEQIQCALLAGEYEFSMQVSFPENVKNANNNLAAYLSIGSLPPSNTMNNLPYTPQFVNTTTITSRNGWTNVSGIITAAGNEDHITLGNFNSDATTNKNFVNSIATTGCSYQGNQSSSSGYYFIDEVILKPHIPNQITVGKSLCGLDVTLIAAGGNSYSYLWNTGASSQSIVVASSGIYTVTVTHATGCTRTATVQITVNPSVSVNVTSTPNCTSNGTAYASVSGGIAPYSFLWSNGQVSNPAYGLANGVYTVTVTASNGCSASGSVSVQSYAPVSINISKRDQCDAAELGAIDASTNSTGPCTYLWSNGLTSASIAQLVAGIYTVTVTNTNTGCTASASVTIQNLSTYAPILVGTSFTSCRSEFPIPVTIDNYNPAYSYTWSVTPTNTNEPPTMTLGSNSSYVDIMVTNGYGCTVTVTATVGNCTFVANYYIQDCCEGTTLPDLKFTDANAADLIAAFGSNNINNIFVNPITINGTLTIDDNVSFNNCKFIMGPASKIEVLPLYTLTINNCYFNACDKMWKGIEVDKNAYLNLTESHVEDAQYAIELKDQALAIIKHVELNNNFVGMYASPQNTLQTIYSTIADVQFQTNSTMVSAYLGQLPLLGSNGFAGILFNDVSYLNVGSFNAGDECQFNTLSNGIVAINTNLNATNNRFYDIQPDIVYEPLTNLTTTNLKPLFYNGSAIVGKGTGVNFINVTGNPILPLPTYATSNFHGNKRCIYFYGVNGNIKNNFMLDLPPSGTNNIGIELRQILDLQKVTIIDNTINASGFGIKAIDNYNAYIEMDNNNISIDGNNTNGVGIFAQNASSNAIGFDIHNNIINAIYCKQGISLNTISNAQVVENIVDMSANSNPSNYFGINLVGSSTNHINCNTVVGNGFNLSASSTVIVSNAYRFNMSTNNEIACNSSDMTDVGFRFLNVCNNSDFRSNTIGQHWQGLRLNASPIISPQIDKGNMWTYLTSYSNNGAYWDGVNASGANDFYVPYGNGLMGNIDFYPTNNGGWFNQSFNIQDNCSNMACKAPVALRLANDSTITNNDLLVAADSVIATEFVAQTTYALKKALNEKLNANPALMNGSTLLTDFYAETEAGTIGQYHDVKAVLDSTTSAEDALDTTILHSRDSLINNLIMIQAIDSMLALPCNSVDSTILQQQKNSLLNSVTQHHVVNDSLTKLKDAKQQSKVTTAALLNDDVTANTEVFEINRKTVNRIFLCTIARQVFQFSITDMEDLIAVAVQCPFSGGKAVYEARAMVDYFNDTIVYDDDANCLAQGYTMKQYKPVTENSFEVKAIPNPASISVTFNYTPDLFETGLLTIIDNLSRKVVVRTINGKGTINVELKGFNPGIYYYKITGGKYCETGKLIVF